MTKSRRRSLKAKAIRIVAAVVTGFVALSLLPVVTLRWVDPPTSAFIIRHNVLADAHPDWTAAAYEWTDWDGISPNLPLAVVASEDQRFPDHWGFDFQAISKALREYSRGDDLRGASTISQQVAKNLFLWPGRNYIRKGLEAYFTTLIELCWPKQRILEVYVNIAQFGPNTFGATAASQRMFNKSPARLTPAEAALLAAVLPNPYEYNARRPSGYVRERQRWIMRQMQQLGGTGYLKRL
ncbi:Biosynthetic peptidoglycan transglycosylase [wastewater metagenome]|uniref:Biosynthetic peptidoglycan transglycosylase n=2 Tax=unclassified sequences TaxID=12908 RepID=A0A5B8REE4_9ZZZZ|nr:biosynthetic peptidoglycan transglycosylase [uncultured organism]